MLNFIKGLFCKSKSTTPPLSPAEDVVQTLKAIDRVGGYGFSVTPPEMLRMINEADESPVRKQLAFSLNISEGDLQTAMRSHLNKGGSIFACIGLADMQLAEPQ